MLPILWKAIFLFSSASALLDTTPTSPLQTFNGTAEVCIVATDQCVGIKLCDLNAFLGSANLITLIGQDDVCSQGTATVSLSLTSLLSLSIPNFIPTLSTDGCACSQCQGTCELNPLAGCNITNSTDTSGQIPVVDTPISGLVAECTAISPTRNCSIIYLCNLQSQPPVLGMNSPLGNFPRGCIKGKANLLITNDPTNPFNIQLSNFSAPVVPADGNCTCGCGVCKNNAPFVCPSNTTTTPCPSRYTSTTASCPSTTTSCSTTTTPCPSTTTSSPSTTTSCPSTSTPSTAGCTSTLAASTSTPTPSCFKSTSTTQQGNVMDLMNSVVDMVANT